MNRLFLVALSAFTITIIALYILKISEDTKFRNTITEYEQNSIEILGKEEINYDKPKEEADIIATFDNVLNFKTAAEYQHYIYNIDKTAYVDWNDISINELVNMDLKTELHGELPRILIFHTHSQEDYVDSRKGKEEDSIIGMGEYLANILAKNYNIPVVHDIGKYDFIDGKVERGNSYQKMEPAVTKILQKYPSIEIAIDLHRDGVPDNVHLVTEINGKRTAKIMFFNGVTTESRNGRAKKIKELHNPYLKENLSLSLQAYLHANEMYSGLMRKIYIKPYRYSLHLIPKSMLVELGANTNTVEEARNAVPLLAEILVKTLSAKEQ